MKHTILFLAANPLDTDRLRLDEEAQAIQRELERSCHRDCFDFVTRWAVQPLDVLRELRKLKPTVVHFSGHGGQGAVGNHACDALARRNIAILPAPASRPSPTGLVLQAPDGRAQIVPVEALQMAMEGTGVRVQLVVLNACCTEAQAEALAQHVDCVVGMSSSIPDDSARSFAIGFYGALGDRESVMAAYSQGKAAIALQGLPDSNEPKIKVRNGVDASKVILASGSSDLRPAASERIDFTAERQRHLKFVGREDVLARLDEWLDAPAETGWVVVTGGPGMGKSAILSEWLKRREAGGASVPHHFIRRQVADWDQPETIVASLAAQIEAAFPTLRREGEKPERRLLNLLLRFSQQLAPAGPPLVLLIDGLDETRAEPGDNPLPRFLPTSVPGGVQLLCATRSTYPHLGWLEQRHSLRRLDLDDRQWATSNEAVVQGFWEAAGAAYKPPLSPETIAQAVTRAEGNVLHAVMLHETLRDLPAEHRNVNQIPRGLPALIGDIWDRAAVRESVRAGFGLLCAAREALSLDVLGDILGWSYQDRDRFVPESRQLLLEEPAAWAGMKAYRPRHEWVRELIVERLGAAAVRGHHVTLARALATWPPRIDRRYSLRHALVHRLDAGDCTGAWQLAADTLFLAAKCREIGVHESEADLLDAARRCEALGDETRSRRFEDLALAIARESHWLRQASDEPFPALIMNRLRRFGWTMTDIDAELRVPAEITAVRVRHVATRESGALVRNLTGHASGVNACVIAPDGRLVSASRDGRLKVWDLATGRVLVTMEHSHSVTACAISADGQRVLAGAGDGTLSLWVLASGRLLTSVKAHDGPIMACALMPDGWIAVSASNGRMLRVWDMENGRQLATLQGHGNTVTACTPITGGYTMVSASSDRTLRIWNLRTGVELATLKGHTDTVRACAVTSDGRRVLSASNDETLRVWEVSTARVITTLKGHTDAVTACAVSADNHRAVSASDDRTLRIWDLDRGRPLATIEGHAVDVTSCAVTANGARAVSGLSDGMIKLWDLRTQRGLSASMGHDDAVTTCAVTPDGRRAVSGSEDRTLKVWDPETGQALTTLNGHASRLTACAVTPDGRHLVSASDDETLKIWELATGRMLDTLEGHADAVTACAVTPDGKRVVSASWDNTLKIWDLKRGVDLANLEGSAQDFTACAVARDGRRLVAACADATLQVYDLVNMQALVKLIGHEGAVAGCALTTDGAYVVSASWDETLKIWNLNSGQVIATLEGHLGAVMACAMTPDGQHIVSASSDCTVKIWDLGSGTCVATHHGDAPYNCVATGAGRIVAADAAGSVWFLDSRFGLV